MLIPVSGRTVRSRISIPTGNISIKTNQTPATAIPTISSGSDNPRKYLSFWDRKVGES